MTKKGDNMSKKSTSLGKINVLRLIEKTGARVFFLGVGGVGMSGLFCLSAHFGINVSGADRERGEYADALIKSGADIKIGGVGLPEGVDLVVFTTAVSEDDAVLRDAERRGVPCVTRAEYLGALMLCYGVRIGISGSHGKSTTTAMLHSILKEAGKNPTTLCGAGICDGGSVEVGALDYMVYEACEYKDAFLSFSPSLAIFLNLEYDHPDYFKSMSQLSSSFLRAMSGAEAALVNADDEKLMEIAKKLDTPPILFGKGEGCKYRYKPKGYCRGVLFELYKDGRLLGEISIPMLGDFNSANAAAACAAAIECGVDFDVCKRALSAFSGIPRRLERIGEYCGRAVYYDYAHHPTEIKRSIEAVKSHTGGPVTVVFGAHTYSRTASLWSEFVNALGAADYFLMRKICAVREAAIEGVSAQRLAAEAGGEYVGSIKELLPSLDKTDGSIIVMGAADMSEEKNAILGVDKPTSYD